MRFISEIYFRARTILAAHPAVYFPLYRVLRTRREGILCAATQLTIEGFPRSGNSFAVRAFKRANPDIVVAHHTHAPAQIIESVGRKLPVLLLVREPAAAIRSFALMRPDLSPVTIAWAYTQFHESVFAHLDCLVVATFEEVTQDVGAILRSVNRRFSTKFQEFSHDPQSVATIFVEMEAAERAKSGGQLRDVQIAKPHGPREALKAAFVLQDSPAVRAADSIYTKLLSHRQPLSA